MRRMQAIFTNASAEEGSILRVLAQSSRLAHLAFQNRSSQSSLRQDLKRIGNQNTDKTGLPRVESRISAYRRVLCRNQTSTAYWKKDLLFDTFLKKPSPFWRQAVQMWNTASVEGRVSKYQQGRWTLNIFLNGETAEPDGKPLPFQSGRSHAVAVNTEFAAKGA
ncbi:hypothetical protein [uncultured Ottowia sp.]|uniref:hypothetical protein n=1 Tax=uncultured Ottowia sp. TaxID=543067 RepID=UPI002597113B|nr:hypothetical protein [uncultured Ottowia sp.]